MSEIETNKLTDEITALVNNYANQGDYGRSKMANKYPHIDFTRLLAERMVEQERIQAAADVEPPPTQYLANAEDDQDESIWIRILRITASISFSATIIFGLVITAEYVNSSSMGMAVFVIVVSTISAVIVLAVIMVFINMAKDIASTAKDTAEIKELLKKK